MVNKLYESNFLLASRQTKANYLIILSKDLDILTFTVKLVYIAKSLVPSLAKVIFLEVEFDLSLSKTF